MKNTMFKRLVLSATCFMLFGYFLTTPVFAETSICLAGDINKDNRVNLSDYSVMVQQFSQRGTLSADLNHDQVVNLVDYSSLLNNFGKNQKCQKLFVGAFTAASSPQAVELAATTGINYVQSYGLFQNISTETIQKIREHQMSVVSGHVLNEIAQYGCWRARVINPPPSANSKYLQACTEIPETYKNITTLQAGKAVFLQRVENQLKNLQTKPNIDLISHFWILDDWHGWDAGGVQSDLPEVTKLVHQYFPGRQTICGFGGIAVLPKDFQPTSTNDGFNEKSLMNFSPKGCDIADFYTYTYASGTNTTPDKFDWSMSKTLPLFISTLKEVGKQADPTWDGDIQMIGTGQIFGDTEADSVRLIPRPEDIVVQTTAFCQNGMGIMPFEWTDPRPNRLTPFNSDSLKQGIAQGIENCKK
jgi:hypothetical protein